MRRAGGCRATVVVGVLVLLASSCGLPGSGNARPVDADDVPYRLLDPDAPTSIAFDAGALARKPAVFWVDGERLFPTATGQSCSERTEVLVERLLDTLAAGPSDDGRAEGKSSVVPADAVLGLVGIDDETATVDIATDTSLSAEQLPVAVGQIVLTVTSASSVGSVVLTSDGEPVQVPLPQGALTGEPVSAEDYAELLPARLRPPAAVGCPER